MDVDFVSLWLPVYDGKFILEKKRWGWSIAGGHIEANENPEETLIREVYEEMESSVEFYSPFPREQYDDGAVLATPIFCFEYISSGDGGKPMKHRNIANVYLVRCKTKPEPTEGQELAFLSFDELMDAQLHQIVEHIKPVLRARRDEFKTWDNAFL